MFTTEQIKSFIIGLLLTLLGGVAAKLGLDAATTTTLVTGVASGIVALIMILWRAASKSDNAIIATAAKIIAPDGGVIQVPAEKAAVIPAENVVPKT